MSIEAKLIQENALQEVQQNLLIAQQNNEIMKLKIELEKLQYKKASKLEDSLFSPALYNHYKEVAELMSQSSAVPVNYRGKPNDTFVAIAMGYQVGLAVEQSLHSIGVVHGIPCLYGDGLLALILSHPDCLSIDESPIYDQNHNIIGYSCTVERRGHKPYTQIFTIDDARKAGLWEKKSDKGYPSPWILYPTRMLQMRARSYCLRDKFADALRGIKMYEVEIDNVIEHEPNNEDSSKLTNLQSMFVNAVRPHDSEEQIVENNTDTFKPKHGSIILTSSSPKIVCPPPACDSDVMQGISDDQIAQIESLMDELDFSDERKIKSLEYYKVENISELNASDADSCIKTLQRIKLKNAM